MQADLWAQQGVSIAAGDALIAPRAEEISRRISPVNHYRAIDAANLLGLASLSCHTPADNSVQRFVTEFLDAESPETLDDLVKALRTIPEYEDGARKGYGPAMVLGSGSARAGADGRRHDRRDRGPEWRRWIALSAAGVGTLVGMHYSEEHRKHAEELKLNLVVAGHISSDVLGMNLVLDRVEALGEVQVYCTSGMVRVRRA